MSNQPLICIAAANRIAAQLRTKTTQFVIIDAYEQNNELKKLNTLLYLCKMAWLVEHNICEMIPESFELSVSGPCIPGLENIFSGHRSELRQPRYYLEKRQLTEKEKALIDRVVLVASLWSDYALYDFIERADGLYRNAYGFPIITTERMKLHLSNSQNKDNVYYMAIWGLRPEEEGVALWRKTKVPF
jgi:hypothetical protein